MDRVQRSERLARKRLTCPFDDLRTNSQDVPPRGRRCQVRPSVRGLCLRELAKRGSTKKHTIALDDSQVRGDDHIG